MREFFTVQKKKTEVLHKEICRMFIYAATSAYRTTLLLNIKLLMKDSASGSEVDKAEIKRKSMCRVCVASKFLLQSFTAARRD